MESEKAEVKQRDFLADLRNSYSSVLIAAEYWRKRKYRVTLQPNEECPPDGDWKDFVDDCDLTLSVPIEVKQSSKAWCGAFDYPFAQVRVMAKHAWDSKDPKPHLIMIMDAEAQAAVIVPGSSFPTWIERYQTDSRDGRSQWVYDCSKRKCEWVTL